MIENDETLYTAESFGLDADYSSSPNRSAGEIIKAMYMEPLGLSGVQLAKSIGVASSTINRVINGKSALTPELALKICAVVGGSPAVLLRIDTEYRLAIAEAETDVSNLKRLVVT